MGQRSFANVDGVMLSKKDSTSNTNFLALRKPAKMMFEDDPIDLEKGMKLNNFTKMTLEVETTMCDYLMLKDFIQVYLVDGMVNASIHTAAQQAGLDSRGLKGNEVFNFGWTPNGNGYAGFSFKYRESYSNGEKQTSAIIKLSVTLEKDEMDIILATSLVNVPSYDVPDKSKVNPGHLMSVYHPNLSTLLLEKNEILSYLLEMESVGDGDDTIYARPLPDYLRTKIDFVTKTAGVQKYSDLKRTDEFSPLYIREKISANVQTLKQFNYASLSRTQSLDISDKRRMNISFVGDIPILKNSFSDSTGGGITTKVLALG